MALFLSGYLVATATVLAMEGRTVGKISTSGIELPHDLSASVAAQQSLAEELEPIQAEIETSNECFSNEIEALWTEVRRLRTHRHDGR